jgi:murein DD-endopeptidase
MKMRPRLLTVMGLALLPLLAGCAAPASQNQTPAQIQPPRAPASPAPPTPATHQGTHPATAIATRMLGKPYRYGGASPRGFDCSGLVYYAYHQAGYKVPRTSQLQYRDSLPVKQAHRREGDLLFFRIEGKVSHVGIYLGDNRFIHAPASGKRVTLASLEEPYWRERLTKTGRFF